MSGLPPGDSSELAYGRLRPGRLWSLFEMMQFNALRFHSVTTFLAALENTLGLGGKEQAAFGARIYPRHASLQIGPMKEQAEALNKHFVELGFDGCAAGLGRVVEAIQSEVHGKPGRAPEQAIIDFRARVFDEFAKPSFLVLNAWERGLYEPQEPLFGPDVDAKFQDARDDIDEAGKCLALNRNKATVMHLMLAMELALREMATKLSATLHDKDGKWLPWLKIANNLEPKIRAMPEGPEKEAWWEVHSMLTSVGKAWRNTTMHPARSYSDAQARKVFEAVRGFMEDLAKLI